MPTVPSGELANSSRSDIGRATSTAGAPATLSRIGAKETDTRIEAPMNRLALPASPSVSSPCAPMIPSVCAIM